MRLSASFLLCVCAWTHLASAASPPTLQGTAPLQPASGDERSKAMVAAIDQFSLNLIATASADRTQRWKHALADDAGRAAFKTEMRQKLRGCLGMVDEGHRVPHPTLEMIAPVDLPNGVLAERDGRTVQWVRWPVFEGVSGEGILVRPKGTVRARAICLPDADYPLLSTFAFSDPVEPIQAAQDLAAAGCEVVIPLILDRAQDGTGSERFQIRTNLSHREWIYRQAYVLGRTLQGYEIAKILALADALNAEGAERSSPLPMGIMGTGEGGWLALHAAALDERFQSVWVAGCFASRDHLWEEPLDRNVFGYLNHFDAAEIGALILPRRLQVMQINARILSAPAPSLSKGARAIAAPGEARLPAPALIAAQAARLREMLPQKETQEFYLLSDRNTKDWGTEPAAFLKPLGIELPPPSTEPLQVLNKLNELTTWHMSQEARMAMDQAHQLAQMRELQTFTQARIAECEQEREIGFWKNLPSNFVDVVNQQTGLRAHFWNDLIGKLPDPSVPLNPRSCLITENDAFAEYDVMLDVWPGVTAWGYLLVPKDIKPGEKRPVVVCQHGLEGLPEDTVTEDPKAPGWKFYKGFAAQLARQGFITFAPHNFYRGKDAFRVVQRKLNLTGKTLYSVIIAQHQSILQFLQGRPEVDASRIAFYGLSYGGKSAMRIPAALPGYCLSICSGDFNEWVRKCVSLDQPACYVYSPEYEIWEWNLARTFNYAEMAALIAPRPFMVERGHADGVGLDEWVSYEYAKVRRLYDRLGMGDRTQMEVFDGPHTIHGVGTFKFLQDKLRYGR